MEGKHRLFLKSCIRELDNMVVSKNVEELIALRDYATKLHAVMRYPLTVEIL